MKKASATLVSVSFEVSIRLFPLLGRRDFFFISKTIAALEGHFQDAGVIERVEKGLDNAQPCWDVPNDEVDLARDIISISLDNVVKLIFRSYDNIDFNSIFGYLQLCVVNAITALAVVLVMTS